MDKEQQLKVKLGYCNWCCDFTCLDCPYQSKEGEAKFKELWEGEA